MIRTALFDLDGTLLDSLPIVFGCFREVLRSRTGRVFEDREIRARFGPPESEILATFLPEDQAPEAHRELLACYRARMKETHPFPGVRELLHDLRSRGISTGLVTGRGLESAMLVLRGAGLEGSFQTVVSGDGIRPKPDPEGIHRALTAIDPLRARDTRSAAKAEGSIHDAIYVGDSGMDVEAARRAGVLSGAAIWGATDPAALMRSGADYLFRTVEEARALLLRPR